MKSEVVANEDADVKATKSEVEAKDEATMPAAGSEMDKAEDEPTVPAAESEMGKAEDEPTVPAAESELAKDEPTVPAAGSEQSGAKDEPTVPAAESEMGEVKDEPAVPASESEKGEASSEAQMAPAKQEAPSSVASADAGEKLQTPQKGRGKAGGEKPAACVNISPETAEKTKALTQPASGAEKSVDEGKAKKLTRKRKAEGKENAAPNASTDQQTKAPVPAKKAKVEKPPKKAQASLAGFLKAAPITPVQKNLVVELKCESKGKYLCFSHQAEMKKTLVPSKPSGQDS